MSTQRIDDTVMENIEILAKLSMSEDEREEMRTELEKILDYVEKLNELDTTWQELVRSVESIRNTAALRLSIRFRRPCRKDKRHEDHRDVSYCSGRGD